MSRERSGKKQGGPPTMETPEELVTETPEELAKKINLFKEELKNSFPEKWRKYFEPGQGSLLDRKKPDQRAMHELLNAINGWLAERLSAGRSPTKTNILTLIEPVLKVLKQIQIPITKEREVEGVKGLFPKSITSEDAQSFLFSVMERYNNRLTPHPKKGLTDLP